MPTRPTVPPLLWEPAPPGIETQSASAQGAADLAETALWRYHLRYWHEHQPQDEVIVTVSFNDALAPEGTIGADDAPPVVDCRVTVQLDHSGDGERIEALRLTREAEEAGAGRWPSVDYRSSDGVIVDLGSGVGEGRVRTYVFDPPAPYWSSQNIGLVWDGLDVAGRQSARASLTAVRNRGLGDEEIVYRTATVTAPAVVTPSNRWPDEIDISELGDTVEAALDAAFAALFGTRRIGQRVTLTLSYGHALQIATEPDAALISYLPVGLYTIQPIVAGTTAQIAAMLGEWKAMTDPPITGGRWAISLAQFSQLDIAAKQPLLELGRLVYRLR